MRSHSIAGWVSGRLLHTPQFQLKVRFGWNYYCRRAPEGFAAVGLNAGTGDGFAGLAVGISGWAAAARGRAGRTRPRITISTRRFMPRPSALRLLTAG